MKGGLGLCSLSAQTIKDETIGGESNLLGKRIERKKLDLVQVVTRGRRSLRFGSEKPNANGMQSRVVKVGVNRADIAETHVDAGLLEELATRCLAQILIPFDIATRDAPLTAVGAATAPKQDAVAVEQNHGHADHRVAILDEAAARAARPNLVAL